MRVVGNMPQMEPYKHCVIISSSSTVQLDVPGVLGGMATDSLFGGNILAPRGSMDGDGSYEELVQDLGVTGLRYPGGSLTEEYFDISNPDAQTTTGNETGETVEFIPISDFMEGAAQLGAPVTIVIPTRNQLSEEVDENGDRLPDIDEEVLRDFVYDTVTGVYGDASVQAFEIGNEYWGSGRMSSAEYGRLAAEMSEIISDELQIIQETRGVGDEVDVVIEMGTNFDHASLHDDYDGMSADDILADLNAKYDMNLDGDVIRGSGVINWSEVSNYIIMSFFDDGNIEDIDGVAAHVYSKEPAIDGQRSYSLDTIAGTWGEEFENLDTYVTEWNSSGNTGALERGEDYGLFQAHEMLNIMEQFLESGVDTAHAWPLLQNTANTFSEGFAHEVLTPAGHMFEMMASSLPGLVNLDFAGPESEASFRDVDVHAFYGDGELVFFIASTADGVALTDIDISGLLTGFESATAVVLGVENGQNPGDTASPAELDALALSEFYDDGFLTALLDEGEIMRVILTGIVPTAEFSVVTQGIDDLGYEEGAEDFHPHEEHEVPIEGNVDEGPTEETGEAHVDDGRGNSDTVWGSDGDDQISGGAGDDLLGGYYGNDTLQGGNGADVLWGSFGDDFLEGARDDDTLNGGEGNDTLLGGSGNDRLWGADGGDELSGASGEDVIGGGAGNDTLVGDAGDDTLRGGAGHDRLEGSDGQDQLFGGSGDDTLSGGHDDDWLHGGGGSNLITLGQGRDTIAFDDEGEGFVTRITDFTLGEDRISIAAEDVSGLDDITVVRDLSGNEIALMLRGDPNRQIILEGEFGDEGLNEEDFDFL